MKSFPIDPRLPDPRGMDQKDYLSRLNVRLVDLFRDIAQRLNPTVYYGWRDMVATVSSARVPAANAPTLDNFGPSGNRTEYKFILNDYIMIKPFHVNHDVKPYGQAYLHVHWTTNGTSTATVKWEFEILRAKGHGQEAFGAPVTLSVTQAASGTAWQHMIAEVTDSDALTLYEPDELIMVILRRVTNGGVNNTDQVFAMEVDFHYETDRSFTPYKAPDFYVGT